jgi:AcrR family transcriptional regulator
MAKAVDHDVRKRLVVMKAMKIFAQMGYSKVSFMTISEATGIARTALYRYFKTKRDLFDEAIYELTSGIMIELRDVIAREIPAPKRMEIVCDLVIDELFDKRDFFLAIFDFVFSMVRVGEDMTGRIAMFTDGLKLVFRKLLAEGVESGAFNPRHDPEAAVDALFALIESVAFRVILNKEKSSDAGKARCREVISLLTDASVSR